MPINEYPMHTLARYLPEGCFDSVVAYINHYKIHLTVTKIRKTILGDYRHAAIDGNHRISINGNLNKYEFLITFLHEMAHLLTFEMYRNRVAAHGKEWKQHYSELLKDFIAKGIFPPDIVKALQKSIINPSATANGETALLRVLRNYDVKKLPDGFTVLENLPAGALFIWRGGKVFRKMNKRRTRYECLEIKTGLMYAFSPVAEVKIFEA